jgi:hypothetical protein
MNENVNVNEVKGNVKNVDTWIRGLFIIIYGVIFYVLFWIIWLVVIFQFVMKVLLGRLNPNLMGFSDGLTRYAYQILRYVTFQSEERPWPFGPWPSAEPRAQITDQGATGA